MALRVVCIVLVVVVAASGIGAATPQQPGCDYVSLYDETIDSVVAIQTPVGQGSGFVYRTTGTNVSYVVTNAHVVGDADRVTVQFTRGEGLTGDVLGRDVFADLAVVRVNETPAYVQSLPVRDRVAEHGQPVAALGNPFGLEETITHGIVSGLNRSLPTTLGFAIPNVVQTDAPISPGNSGGPLIDCQGAVVGVNTAGIAAVGAENIGFAVPATVVDEVAPALIRTGEFEHGFLGVSTTALSPAIVEANDLSVTEGAYVVATVEGTPAAAVLQGATGVTFVNGTSAPVGGDVIVAVDGQSVDSPQELTSYLFTRVRANETVSLTIIRDGERRQVPVRLTARPDPQTGQYAP